MCATFRTLRKIKLSKGLISRFLSALFIVSSLIYFSISFPFLFFLLSTFVLFPFFVTSFVSFFKYINAQRHASVVGDIETSRPTERRQGKSAPTTFLLITNSIWTHRHLNSNLLHGKLMHSTHVVYMFTHVRL